VCVSYIALWLRCKHNYWILGQEGPEIINSVTGKDDQGVASRLSKQGLFRRFLNLVGRIGSITGLTSGSCPHQYSEAKEAVQDYKVSSTSFFLSRNHVHEMGWKNMEEEVGLPVDCCIEVQLILWKVTVAKTGKCIVRLPGQIVKCCFLWTLMYL